MVAAVLKLFRSASTDQGTVGVMTFGSYRCYSLELPWRDNLRMKSCIPIGKYTAVWVKSPSKGWCYALQDVPGRSSILVHSGNLAGNVDKGWQTQLLGCIAPFLRAGSMANNKGVAQFAGLVSRPAVDMLHRWGKTKNFTLEIS